MRINSFDAVTDFSPVTAALVVGSSLGGLLMGSQIELDRFWSRSSVAPLRMVQDLLAADFYTERIYRSTIVAFVSWLAELTDSFDRQVITGLTNRIGMGSMSSAESLKLGVSGKLQSYVLTVLAAVVLLFVSLTWLFR